MTTRSPQDSVWQSCVEKVGRRENKPHVVAACHAQIGGAVEKCALLALELAKAKAFGAPDEIITNLQSTFDFSVCDPAWIACIDEYVAHFKLRGDTIPYREGLNNVLDTPVSANAKIALFGDWGTGTPEAVSLLEQIASHKPDILIHLGDVYYSGTQDEMQERFLSVIDTVFGSSAPTTFSLSGNHDMYSGGVGYYYLVDHLGQKASYFAIQNDNWLVVGMDTGVNDCDPFQGGDVASYLMQSEADWINNLVANRGSRKVVFLSHHPLFSAYEAIGDGPDNQTLYVQLQASIPSVAAWFWGHEHRLAIYEQQRGLQRGRCLGHGAVPVFADGNPVKFPSVPVKPIDMGTADGIYKHGFAIVELNGPAASVSYYRQGEDVPLFTEEF